MASVDGVETVNGEDVEDDGTSENVEDNDIGEYVENDGICAKCRGHPLGVSGHLEPAEHRLVIARPISHW